jgi:PAS domain S-box-containing protein
MFKRLIHMDHVKFPKPIVPIGFQRISVSFLLTGFILLILLVHPTKAFEISAIQPKSALNDLSIENCLVDSSASNKGAVLSWLNADESVLLHDQPLWKDTSHSICPFGNAARARSLIENLSNPLNFDMLASAEPDAVDTTCPDTVGERVLAGFSPTVLVVSARSFNGSQYHGAWIVFFILIGIAGLLVLLTKYLFSRRSAVELEQLVEDRTRQLQESSEQYRSLVENAVVGIFRVTSDGHIESANPALAKILQLDDELDILDCNLRDDIFIDPDQWDQILCLEAERGWVTGIEVKWNCCGGEVATVRLSGRWVHQAEGEPVCELIAEDITALKNAHVAEIEAERLRGVQKLAIAVAHEFNNPLSILLGTYQLYIQPNVDQFDHDVQGRLDRVPETVTRMRNLVSRLLQITKLRENEYIHGTSYLNLHQSTGEEEELAPVDEAEDILGGTGRTFASFP